MKLRINESVDRPVTLEYRGSDLLGGAEGRYVLRQLKDQALCLGCTVRDDIQNFKLYISTYEDMIPEFNAAVKYITQTYGGTLGRAAVELVSTEYEDESDQDNTEWLETEYPEFI